MKIEITDIPSTKQGPAKSISPFGDIDMNESPQLRNLILKTLEEKIKVLVINLTQVNFIDSSGIATLVESMKVAKTKSINFVLCGMNSRVLDVFELSRLDKFFKIAPTQIQALGDE